MADCTHLDQVLITELPESVPGCEDCLAIGGKWLHLRICLQCGHVGCCDDSPNRHATAHYRSGGHPIIRSLSPARPGRGASSTSSPCSSPRSAARPASRPHRSAGERQRARRRCARGRRARRRARASRSSTIRCCAVPLPPLTSSQASPRRRTVSRVPSSSERTVNTPGCPGTARFSASPRNGPWPPAISRTVACSGQSPS